MIIFNYNGHEYKLRFITVFSNYIEVSKDSGKVSREIVYSDSLTMIDFLKKLESINFCENM